MDLRAYYQKIREIEQAIPDEYPVVVSQPTPDGGKANVRTEVPRRVAAKMVAEGRARLAGDDEAREFREMAASARRSVEHAAAAARTQVKVGADRASKQ